MNERRFGRPSSRETCPVPLLISGYPFPLVVVLDGQGIEVAKKLESGAWSWKIAMAKEAAKQ